MLRLLVDLLAAVLVSKAAATPLIPIAPGTGWRYNKTGRRRENSFRSFVPHRRRGGC